MGYNFLYYPRYFFSALFRVVVSLCNGTSSFAHCSCFFWVADDVVQFLPPSFNIPWLYPETAALCLDVHRHLRITGAKDRKTKGKCLDNGCQSYGKLLFWQQMHTHLLCATKSAISCGMGRSP